MLAHDEEVVEVQDQHESPVNGDHEEEVVVVDSDGEEHAEEAGQGV